MASRFKTVISIGLYWILFSLIARFLFLAYNYPLTFEMGINDFCLSFIYGLRLDISLMGYLLLLSSLLISFLFFVKGKFLYLIFKYTHILFISIFSLIIVIDFELYRNWSFRMDTTPLKFLATPSEAMASSPIWLTTLLFFIIVLLSFLAYKLFKRMVLRKIAKLTPGHWTVLPTFLLIAISMILPIRGGFGIAPINTGAVYFSDKLYSNHAAINEIWNFNYSISKMNENNMNVAFYTTEKTDSIVASLYPPSESNPKIIPDDKAINVILIIMESFTSNIIEPLGGKENITPFFNQICNEAILFSNIYATSTRSDKGLVGILSGYPAQPQNSIMKFPNKSQSLPYLFQDFERMGYQTSFLYGGDIHFANIKSYLKNSGVNKITSIEDFPDEMKGSKWGVHDHHTFQYLFDDINSTQTNFFKAFFTLSSHEPFIVPHQSTFYSNNDRDKYLNSANYTDSCFGDFIKKAKQTAWWDQTLIIAIADHGIRFPNNPPIDSPKRYAIPMVWTGGAIDTTMVISKTGSQIDLATTLMSQFPASQNNYQYSKNLLAKNTLPFAWYTYSNGFGYIKGKENAFYSLTTHSVTKNTTNKKDIESQLKALTQAYLSDFNQRPTLQKTEN